MNLRKESYTNITKKVQLITGFITLVALYAQITLQYNYNVFQMTEEQLVHSYKILRFGLWSGLYYHIQEGFFVQLLIQQYYYRPISGVLVFFRVYIWVAIPQWILCMLLFQIKNFSTTYCDEQTLWLREIALVPNVPFDNKSCGWEFHLPATYILNTIIHILIYIGIDLLRSHFSMKASIAKIYFGLSAVSGLLFLVSIVYVVLNIKASTQAIENYVRRQEIGTFLHLLGSGLAASLFSVNEAEQNTDFTRMAYLTDLGSSVQQLFSYEWLGDFSVVFAFVMFVGIQQWVEVDYDDLGLRQFGKFILMMVIYVGLTIYFLTIFSLGIPKLLMRLQNVWVFSATGKIPYALFIICKVIVITNLSHYGSIKFGPYVTILSVSATVAVLVEILALLYVAMLFLNDVILNLENKQNALFAQIRHRIMWKSKRKDV